MRISTPTGTCILLFTAALTIATLSPALRAYQADLVPAVGTVAGVSVGGIIEPTPTNTLYEDLQKEKQLLDAKRKDLDAEQAYMRKQKSSQSMWLYGTIVLLFLLILINFYLDRKRSQEHPSHTLSAA